MIKKLYLDVETTGLNPVMHSIHQVAGFVEFDGKVVDKFSTTMSPSGQHYSMEALDKCGVTWEELQGRQHYKDAYKEFMDRLALHLEPGEKFFMVGYNSRFDEDFVRTWMRLGGGDYKHHFWNPSLCVMGLAAEMLVEIRPVMPDFKLTTVVGVVEDLLEMPVSRRFDKSKAHDAYQDIRMTRFLYKALKHISDKLRRQG